MVARVDSEGLPFEEEIGECGKKTRRIRRRAGSGGRFFEYEDRGMITTLAPKIARGELL